VSDNLTVLAYYRWDKAPISHAPSRTITETKMFLPLIYRNIAFQPYLVSPGETLLEIALRFETTVQALMDANYLQSPNDISEGQELIVPIIVETEGSTSENAYP
jgi:hypothetical protein